MFTTRNPFQPHPIGNPVPLSVRFKRFLKTQPVLAILIGQTILTYFYISATFWYGLFFVLLLYFGGVFLRQYYTDITLVVVYLTGALAGLLVFPLMFPSHANLSDPLFLAAVQGSAVAGILAFTAVARPDLTLRFFLFMRMKFMLIVAVLLTIMILRKDLDGGGTHLAYLSGALFAVLLAFTTDQHLFDKPVQWFRNRRHTQRRRKFKKYQTENLEDERPLRDEEYNDIRGERQKKIDAILDKISSSGYDSLTREEKELLFKQSK